MSLDSSGRRIAGPRVARAAKGTGIGECSMMMVRSENHVCCAHHGVVKSVIALLTSAQTRRYAVLPRAPASAAASIEAMQTGNSSSLTLHQHALHH
jgi:hypothetical protein